MATTDKLTHYKAKRNFSITSEPAEGGTESPEALQFVIQKHWASRLHYDFRIELDGVMKSWAVPKGPSYDPHDKRMAVHVEDHPISYNSFEGEIPAKQYGAGKVIIWDKGVWVPIGDPHTGYEDGNLKFELHGHKMRGKWALIRIRSRDSKQNTWLLIKEHDAFERPAAEFSVVDEFSDSVAQLAMPAGPTAGATPPRADEAREVRAKRTKVRKATLSDLPAAAVEAPLPEKLAPLLATLAEGPPPRPDEWIYEIKFDGYRILTRVEGGRARLVTRNGHDWTDRMPHLAKAIERMKLRPGWLDGEIVVLNDRGTTDFQALQNAFDSARTQDIVYFLFDIPFYAGHDLTAVPLIERRALLQSLLAGAQPPLRFSETFEAPPRDIVASACKIGLEGIIAKRKDSSYVFRRSGDWLKLKCSHRQEFVICGYTDPKGSRVGIGALVLGVHDDQGQLIYAGNVGTGFDDRSLAALLEKLQPLVTDKRPFAARIEKERQTHWVKPQLLAEVTFAEWTSSGSIRHAVFHALRSDKPAKAIVREKPIHPTGADLEQATTHTLPGKLKVSNPERVIDPSTGVTKVEVVRFYALVAPLMMEHLKARPVALVRAPEGIGGDLFFQKHLDKGKMEGIRQLDPALYPGHPQMLEVANAQGLLSAAQMNVIEFHTWNALKTLIGKPDRMTFDLDPGDGVAWSAMQQAAELMRVFLEQLGLVSFCKTSGGKGLHVVVPLKRQYGWDTVKDFSQAIVQHMARTLPRFFVAKSGPRNRVGKIFIDYLRNGFGATTACAWSVRARPGLGVSVPIGWEELSRISSGAHWTLQNIHTRLDQGNGPWEGYGKSSQGLAKPMKVLGFGDRRL
ncbi:DNA ligase D [Variovorax sp. UMC13]|uniref:DNA ligase D n=1 Tax=Variovorax sp. UMC13 TaxID=1862326 RepID=UPI001601FA8F|nr:DNA ligase D [Variovorax sp. UMC13]MBB1600396.1 ATP-dependent DNA ligase [Variovorax sp. UMC13]